MEFTIESTQDCLILAIGRQEVANRELCRKTSKCDRTVVWPGFRVTTQLGFCERKPGNWFELTPHLHNVASRAIRELETAKQVELIRRSQRVRLCGLNSGGLSRLRDLDPVLGRKRLTVQSN